MEELKNIPTPKEMEEMTEEDFEEKELNEKEEMLGEEMAYDEEKRLGLKSRIYNEQEQEQSAFYRIEPNENGDYIKDGKRYDLQSCHETISLETYETGEFETVTDEEGNEIQIPITATRVVVNKGWLEFETEEQAIEYFGLNKVGIIEE